MIALLTVLVVMSWLFWLTAWLCTCDFFRRPQELFGNDSTGISPQSAQRPLRRPLAIGLWPFANRPRSETQSQWLEANGQRLPSRSFAGFPPVSVLKPIKGVDADAYECLRSFVQQDYPEYEVLMGMLDADDPAMGVVSRLQREHPDRVRLVVAEPVGCNNKASILHTLAQEARHPILVASDSDMRVEPDCLRRVVAPLRDPGVGLVTCPYVGDKALTLTARLEALHMGVIFLPMVMVARRYLNMRFAMGAASAFRAEDLQRIGGFAVMADYLADDFQLGYRLSGLGMRVHLSDVIPRVVLGSTTFKDQWDREVRWQRCNRVNRPLEYPALLLTMSTPLALLLMVLSEFSVRSCALLLATLCIRWWVAWGVSGRTGDRESRRWIGLLPLRDLLSGAVWLAGGLGNSIQWRGERYTLVRGGKLAPAPESPRRHLPRLRW